MARTIPSVTTSPVGAPVESTYQSPFRPDATRLPWLSTVSYTHLDVYKRQEQYGARMLGKIGVDNTYSIGVTQAVMDTYHPAAISDLAPIAGERCV